jgi:uncharacterized protein YggE
MTQEKQVNIVVAVDGIGEVSAKNDLATFTMQIRTKDEELKNAEAKLKDKTAQVMKELQDLGMSLHSEISQNTESFRLEHREGSEKIPAGFSATNTISFTVNVDERINDIYKKCVKIDQHIPYPWFSIKEIETLKTQAIEKAAEDARKKLAKECELVGVAQSNLRVHNWVFSYDGNLPTKVQIGQHVYAYGPSGATGPQGAIGNTAYLNSMTSNFVLPAPTKIGSTYQEALDIKLFTGQVSVKVAVKINYVWA